MNYKFENFWYTTAQGKASLDFLGFDPTDEIFQNRVIEAAKPYGEKAVNVVKADLEVAKAVVTDEATVVITSRPEKFKKFQAKNLVKWNKSIWRKKLLDVFHNCKIII